MTVSPGPGNRGPRMTRSVLMDPTTMIFEFGGMSSSLNDGGVSSQTSHSNILPAVVVDTNPKR